MWREKVKKAWQGERTHKISDFLAQLGPKAGSMAQLFEVSGLQNLKPEPVFKASKGLGLVWPESPGFPGFTSLSTGNNKV